jgi:hypothetical protein
MQTGTALAAVWYHGRGTEIRFGISVFSPNFAPQAYSEKLEA